MPAHNVNANIKRVNVSKAKPKTVLTKVIANLSGTGAYYPDKIDSVNSDGTLNIIYDDG